MKRIAALALGLGLAAPAVAIDMPPPAPIKSIDWIPASTVRIGDGINAAYRVTTLAGQISEVWLHTACPSRQKTLLFINTQPGKGLRVYSTDSIDRYTPGTPFEPEADSPFMANPELDLCKQNIPEPKWAGIAAADRSGETQFVDTRTALRKGPLLKVRLATDYARIHYDEKYGAPYSVKIQDLMLNCEKAQGIVLATFSLDNQGVATDITPGEAANFVALPADISGVAQRLCAVKDITRYTGTGTLTWREKAVADNAAMLPDLEHNTPDALQRFALPAKVTNVIDNTFSDPRQRPAFRSIRYTQSGPEKGGPGLMSRIDARPDGTTLTIIKMTLMNAVFYSQYQRLFNLVDVKKWETLSEAPWVSNALETTLVLPPRPGEEYLAKSDVENRDKPGSARTLSQQCVAGKEWHLAADLSPRFPGRYREFICRQDRGDGREASSDYAYFEELRVFIRIGYQAEGKAKRFTFTDVEVIR